jgi:cation diffusion facilitator CzcD-associated flavoprotein CzcO
LRGFIPPEFSGGAGQLQRTEILVVGAGPAGLTTAYMLAKAGRDVTVIERDPIYVGGISRTVITRAFFSTSAAIASSRNRRKSSRYGMKSSPMISSSGRASHAYSIAASSIRIR